MDNFIAARSQMALSLAFHIIFSCIGMVMPFFMAVAHYKCIKTKNEVYKNITKAWMNSPAGFNYVNGQYINIDPIKAMFNKAWFSQSLHMSIAAFAATGFAVAGVHAYMILRRKNPRFHTEAFKIAVLFGIIAAIL